MSILCDTPLSSISGDKFRRGPLVSMIIDSVSNIVLTNHECVVYGIYGKWGEGKTSLMNFVKEGLLNKEKDDKISIVEFNPWLVNNEETLLRELYKVMASNTKDELTIALEKYSSMAILTSKTIVNAFIPGIGGALAEGITLVKDAFVDCKDSLVDLKKKVSDAIRKSERHLIVMIDDVDRLDKEELHTLLRILRQVADFDNCIYIVAMDVDLVAKAISDYHGNGSTQDGRKFLDKIVQVPIVLPHVPSIDMSKLISQELSLFFPDLNKEQIEEITEAIIPFMETYRDFKRYCNQMKFVYPHLKGEVNMKDLFLLEAIKMASLESYKRIHECHSQLMRESTFSGFPHTKEEDESLKQKKYLEAKEYIISSIYGPLKGAINIAIDALFDMAYNYQDDVDQKRITTKIYFNKYFTLMVPSNLIADRELDDFKSIAFNIELEKVVSVLDSWNEKFSSDEVKRAVLYIIRKSGHGIERCKMASIMAKALSVSTLSKNMPPHIYVDVHSVVSFVPMQIIIPYMFGRDLKNGMRIAYDKLVIDNTLEYIFRNGEINFCLNMLCSCDEIFSTSAYDGKEVIMTLIRRFNHLEFEEQIKISKFILQNVFEYWQKCNRSSFNIYFYNLFTDVNIPILSFFNKMIDEAEAEKDITYFVKLFNEHISVINKRLDKELLNSKDEPYSVRVYRSNYDGVLRKIKF